MRGFSFDFYSTRQRVISFETDRTSVRERRYKLSVAAQEFGSPDLLVQKMPSILVADGQHSQRSYIVRAYDTKLSRRDLPKTEAIMPMHGFPSALLGLRTRKRGSGGSCGAIGTFGAPLGGGIFDD